VSPARLGAGRKHLDVTEPPVETELRILREEVDPLRKVIGRWSLGVGKEDIALRCERARRVQPEAGKTWICQT